MIPEIKNRKSVRRYKSGEVTDQQVLQMIDSARLAPSGNNTQPWNFIIVRDADTKEKLAKANGKQMWMTGATVFLACVADIKSRIKSGEVLYIDEESTPLEVKQIIRDTAVAIEHILLEATGMGFGTCWTAEYSQKDIRPILGIPDDNYVVGLVTIGYADGENKQPPKRPLEDMVRYEKW